MIATFSHPAENKLVLENVSWDMYVRLLDLQDGRPSLRLTYDRGILEIMSPKRYHEKSSRLLGRFITAYTEELAIEITGGGSTTYQSRLAQRGLEPDDSYWIAHEHQMRGIEDVDLQRDPPPDLCIEVDVTNSSLDRMGIYASLGVPEVWRFDEQGLVFLTLRSDGQYHSVNTSLSLPVLSPAIVLQFLDLRGTLGDNAVIRQFREWVRQNRPSQNP